MIEFSGYFRVVLKILLFFILLIRLLGFLWFQSYSSELKNISNILLLIVLAILVFIPDKIINKFFYYGITLSGVVIVGLLIDQTITLKQNFVFLGFIGISIILLLATYIINQKIK